MIIYQKKISKLHFHGIFFQFFLLRLKILKKGQFFKNFKEKSVRKILFLKFTEKAVLEKFSLQNF